MNSAASNSAENPVMWNRQTKRSDVAFILIHYVAVNKGGEMEQMFV